MGLVDGMSTTIVLELQHILGRRAAVPRLTSLLDSTGPAGMLSGRYVGGLGVRQPGPANEHRNSDHDSEQGPRGEHDGDGKVVPVCVVGANLELGHGRQVVPQVAFLEPPGKMQHIGWVVAVRHKRAYVRVLALP